MAKYYCPHCGSKLNRQSGFDSSYGTWTCIVCGQHLMDDDVYKGDKFQGVAWFCDDCGALLNRQPGFSDNFEKWSCVKCGHINGLTESDIYKSHDDYLLRKGKKTEDYENTSDEDYDYLSSEDDEYQDNTSIWLQLFGLVVKTVLSDSTDDNDMDDEHEVDKKIKFEPGHTNFKLRAEQIKASIFNKRRVRVGYNIQDLYGKNVQEVNSLLFNNAFNNINNVSINDIYIRSPYKEGQVGEIIIGGKSFFTEYDTFPYDTEIIIRYHNKVQFKVPFSPNSLRKKEYREVVNSFKNLGFTEVYEIPIKDLITGWVKKEGSVEKVLISNSSNFEQHTSYTYDTKIIVYYHSFLNK